MINYTKQSKNLFLIFNKRKQSKYKKIIELYKYSERKERERGRRRLSCRSISSWSWRLFISSKEFAYKENLKESTSNDDHTLANGEVLNVIVIRLKHKIVMLFDSTRVIHALQHRANIVIYILQQRLFCFSKLIILN